MRRIFVTYIIFFLLTIIISCDKGETEYIALVGDKSIAYKTYNNSFFFEPVYSRGDTWLEARTRQLQMFIDEKLFAYGGEGISVDTMAFYGARLAWYRKTALVESYFEKHIFEKMVITQSEMASGFEKRRRRVHLRHLFFKDSLVAARSLEALQQQILNFDDLATKVFKSEQLRQSGGDLGICKFGELEMSIENEAFKLKAGEISDKIIKSEFGYHILKAEEIYIDFLPTQEAYDTFKEDIKGIIKTRKMRSGRRQLVNQLIAKNPVNIKVPVFEKLAGFTSLAIDREFENETNPFIPNVLGKEISRIATQITDIENGTLVTYGNKEWRVKDFLYQLRAMPPTERPRIDSEAALYNAVKYMILDEIIKDQALKENLDKREDTIQKVEEFADRLQASLYTDDLFSSVSIDSSQVLNWFMEKYGKIPDKGQNYILEYAAKRILNKKRSRIIALARDSLANIYRTEVIDSLLLKDIPDPQKKIDFTPSPVLRKRLF